MASACGVRRAVPSGLELEIGDEPETFGHIRTYSEIFGHIRTYSDIFGPYSDHIRTIFGSYLGWAIHDALGDQTSHVECACTCMFCPDSRVFVLRLLPPWPPQTHP